VTVGLVVNKQGKILLEDLETGKIMTLDEMISDLQEKIKKFETSSLA
jgi:hypothetical protein